jgi:hypothetical protein
MMGAPTLSPLIRLLERCQEYRPGRLGVLTYHRIGCPLENPAMDADVFSARPDEFRRHMECLVEYYHPVCIHEVIDAVHNKSSLPPRAVLVTFDDGYRDFAEHAWPVLRELGIPVTLFVPTGYPGAPEREFWWDRLTRLVTESRLPGSLEGPWGRLQISSARDRQTVLRRLKCFMKNLPHREAMDCVERLCADGPHTTTRRASVLSWDQLRNPCSTGSVPWRSYSEPPITQSTRARRHSRGDRRRLGRFESSDT